MLLTKVVVEVDLYQLMNNPDRELNIKEAIQDCLTKEVDKYCKASGYERKRIEVIESHQVVQQTHYRENVIVFILNIHVEPYDEFRDCLETFINNLKILKV